MALKGDRQVDAVEIRYFLNEVASKGVVVSVSTAGSGVAVEDVANLATVAANSSGSKPLGILLTDFVNVDLTRTPINWHKDQAQKGSKAAILTKGWVVTDQVAGTPNAGDYACLTSSGSVTGVAPGTSTYVEAANPKVGRFRTKKNEDGFASVYVDL
jgi:hypothetical protein